MPTDDPPPPRFDAPLEDFERRAEVLLAHLRDGAAEAIERFKWEHPDFDGAPVQAVAAAVEKGHLDLDDARRVEARSHGFDDWPHLVAFISGIEDHPITRRFEAAIEDVVDGRLDALSAALERDPSLVEQRSERRHRATLLHYLGANGVEWHRQRTPANAPAVAELLLDAGAAVDATADLYGAPCTTLTLLISSHHPAAAGVQAELAGILMDRGARLVGHDGTPASALRMVLSFGYGDTALALRQRLPAFDDLAVAAGLGDVADMERLVEAASPLDRQIALALAASLGHARIVESLVAAGADPARFNPPRFHAHSTPLHQAAHYGHIEVARVLVGAGADLDAADTIYGATPAEWARHAGRTEVEALLLDRGEAGRAS